MLLIDPGRAVASLPPDATLVPWLPRDFGGDASRAHAFLLGAASLDRMIPVLVKEFALIGVTRRISASLPMLILSGAARAIAAGSITVGQIVPDRVSLVMRQSGPVTKHLGGAVRFARQSVAVSFLRRCVSDPAALAAIEAVVAHPIGQTRQPPADANERLLWLGRQLMVHALAIFPQASQREGPHGADVQQLLIGWIAHTVPTKVTPASDAPPPSSLSSVAQIVQAVENALPELPADISAQAQTLLDASKDGIPFCEECAKAAMGLLGV
jgi:hypothetical protein